jgi:hypothetical protein
MRDHSRRLDRLGAVDADVAKARALEAAASGPPGGWIAALEAMPEAVARVLVDLLTRLPAAEAAQRFDDHLKGVSPADRESAFAALGIRSAAEPRHGLHGRESRISEECVCGPCTRWRAAR